MGAAVVGEEGGWVVSRLVDVPAEVLRRSVVVVLDEVVAGAGEVLLGSAGLVVVPPPGREVVVTGGGGSVVVEAGGGGADVVGGTVVGGTVVGGTVVGGTDVVVPLSARLANLTMETANAASTRRTASTAVRSDSHTPSLKRCGKYL